MTGTEFQIELLPEHQVDPDVFVNFGDICRCYSHTQTQYGSKYLLGVVVDFPNLGEGLSFRGDPNNYHSLEIRCGDVPTFVSRFL